MVKPITPSTHDSPALSKSLTTENESAATLRSSLLSLEATLPPTILYACIVRRGCSCCDNNNNDQDDDETLLLVHGGAERLGETDINYTALQLLEQTSNLGWDAFDPKPKYRRRRGLKFHVYQERRGNDNSSSSMVQIYAYACVYDTKRCSKALAQAFLINLVEATQELRSNDEDWRGAVNMLACQDSCGPLLQQHLNDVSLLWGSQWMQPASPASLASSSTCESATPSPKHRVKAAVSSHAMSMARNIMLQNRRVMGNHTRNRKGSDKPAVNEVPLPTTPSQMMIHVPAKSPPPTSESDVTSTTLLSPQMPAVDIQSLKDAVHSPVLLPAAAEPFENAQVNEFALSPRSVVASEESTESATSGSDDVKQVDVSQEELQPVEEKEEVVKDIEKCVDPCDLSLIRTDCSTSETNNDLVEYGRPWWWFLSNLNGNSLDKEPPKRILTAYTDADATTSQHHDETPITEAEHPCFCIPSLFARRSSLIE